MIIKTSVGLDIGASSIKVMELKETGSGIEALHFALKEFPPELQGRERSDPYRMAGLVGELLREAGIKRTRRRQVTAVVSGPEVGIRRITLPRIPKKELLEALKWEGKKYFPFPLDRAILDYYSLGEVTEGDVKKLNLMVVAARQETVNQELSILNSARLKTKGIEVVPFALWNILNKTYLLNEEQNIALLDMGAEEVNICIFKGPVLQFTREIFTGSSTLTQALAATLPPEAGLQGAEELKRRHGISQETLPGGEGGESFFTVLRPVLDKMLVEVERSFDFYRTQFHEKTIDRILISGGGAELKGLPEFMENSLGIPVEVFNPFLTPGWRIKVSPSEGPEGLSPRMVVAAGLALSQAREINLLPPEIQRAKKERQGKLFLFVVLPVLITLLLFGLYYRQSSLRIRYEAELAQRKGQWNGLSPQLEKIRQLEAIKADLENRKRLHPSLLNLYPPFSSVLKEIGQKFPENATIVGISIEKSTLTPKNLSQGRSDDQKSPPETPSKETKSLRLKGIIFGANENVLFTLARLLADLENSPYLDGVKLVSAEEDHTYNRAGVSFELLCRLRRHK